MQQEENEIENERKHKIMRTSRGRWQIRIEMIIGLHYKMILNVTKMEILK